MKRLRLWVNSFNLVQQFLSIGFLALLIFGLFSFTFLSENIDTFIDSQMYDYLQRSQREYLVYRDHGSPFEDVNVSHFVLDQNGIVQSEVSEEQDAALQRIFAATQEGSGSMRINGHETSYYVRSLDQGLTLISVLSPNYRSAFERALFDSVINVTLAVIFLLILFIVIWIFTLLRPLNQMRSYIEKIRDGQNPRLNIERRDEIGEVAEALVDMQQELQKQQQIREEMIQNISHDLKTPIATIKSYSESIKDGIYPYGTLEKSVDVIIEHADRLEKKVYSLITFNKMGYLMDNAEKGASLPMIPVVQKAIMSVKVLRSDIRIDTNLADVSFHGEEDPWRIVLENLLDNALRYARSLVRVTLREDLLEVYNDGGKMSDERIEKLFKPYEKGSNGNFGLGLSIVKKVCETYGYHVSGANTSDGVVFRIVPQNKRKKKQ
ncbi:MAG: HAMP domain-containing histidine kinase [Erysipelotrichaceae bacterium]|nr:HAMP domain-containing histidine kinase [Erysipelotrichaceae bacterium]